MKKRMFFAAALAVVIVFCTFGQANPASAAKEVNVVIVNGSGDNSKDIIILAAFQKAVVDAGFRLGNISSPYTLEVSFALTDLEMPNSSQKFVRYDISANFIDTTTRQTLIPIYAINSRTGHFTVESARNSAANGAGRKINEEYKDFIESNFPE
jgi:hypothetical protein